MQDSEQTAVLGRETGKRGLGTDFISQQKIKVLAQEENLLLEEQETCACGITVLRGRSDTGHPTAHRRNLNPHLRAGNGVLGRGEVPAWQLPGEKEQAQALPQQLF